MNETFLLSLLGMEIVAIILTALSKDRTTKFIWSCLTIVGFFLFVVIGCHLILS